MRGWAISRPTTGNLGAYPLIYSKKKLGGWWGHDRAQQQGLAQIHHLETPAPAILQDSRRMWEPVHQLSMQHQHQSSWRVSRRLFVRWGESCNPLTSISHTSMDLQSTSGSHPSSARHTERVQGKDVRLYLVRWKNQSADKDEWLPENNIPDGAIHLRNYRASKRSGNWNFFSLSYELKTHLRGRECQLATLQRQPNKSTQLNKNKINIVQTKKETSLHM